MPGQPTWTTTTYATTTTRVNVGAMGGLIYTPQWATQRREQMNCYFIANVSDTRKRRLGDSGIPYYEHVLQAEHRVNGTTDLSGILIQDPHLNEALAAMGAKLIETKETTMVGIFHIEIRNVEADLEEVPVVQAAVAAPSTIRVEFDRSAFPFNGKKPELFEAVIKRVLEGTIKGEVRVFCPHKYATQPRPGGDFNIYLWSSPSGAPAVPPPATMFGIPVSCRDYVFRASRTGETISDPAGYHVAELLEDKHLYIHHDVVEYGDENELKIFEMILEGAKEVLGSDPQARAERRKKIERELTESYREIYIKNSVERFTVRKKQAETQVGVLENRSKELQVELINTIRNLEDQRKILEAETPNLEIQKKALSAEFDRLIAIDKIRRVTVDKNCLSIYTQTLYCDDPRTKKTHEIGEFRIDVSFNPARGAGEIITWTNLTRKVHAADRDMFAPHVQSNGRACLGNLAEMIPPLVAQYQFAALAMIGIQFIESVNVNDGWGAHINKWPIVEKTKAEEGNNVEVVEQA